MSREKNNETKIWKVWVIVIAAAVIVGAVTSLILIIKKNSEKSENHTGVMLSDTESDSDSIKISENDGNIKTSDNSKVIKVSSSDVSEIAENVMPSVVTVNCVIEYSYGSDPLEELFGYGYGFDFGYDGGYGKTYEGKASGTGFIIGQNKNDILLVTNNHVIEKAKKVKVTFVDGTEAEATVKGSDDVYDVAVLSVDGSKLSKETLRSIKIATIGNSDNVVAGDMTIAIGNALGYGQSVTVGYISALDRKITVENHQMELLQSDTAINEGNSGGPLVNIYGEVIGITNAKTAQNNGQKVEGVCYAIPISQVVPIINDLMNREEIDPSEAGYLGIKGKEVSESYSKAFDMPVGVYVNAVEKDSPAEKAGIRKGDIITSLNGRKITNMDELKELLSYIKYGTEVEIGICTVNSGYEEQSIKVVLGKR